MTFSNTIKATFCVFLCVVIASCSQQRTLAPTPNIFAGGQYPEADIAESQKQTVSQILYVTDRQSVVSGASLDYNAERSSAAVLGASTIAFGDGLTWDELRTSSGTQNRRSEVPLTRVRNDEILRLDATPIAFSLVDGRPVQSPEAVASYERKKQQFQSEIRAQLRDANTQDIVIFVHGFNNSHEDAVLSLADVWHFSGRTAVPIAYTWPAGAGGVTGYFKDRESGEFSVFHLKEFLTHVSEMPEVENIHILAHSRGTDVTTTALRELVIAVRNQGKSPRQMLKIENLILAAPDLDFEVIRQRLIAEQFGPAIGRITVYMNQSDNALGVAQRLFAGQRFGTLTIDDLKPTEREIFTNLRTINFVNVEGVKGLTGHAYFRENPSVLSDIALLIRESPEPGSAQRPMVNIGANFWNMPQGYPYCIAGSACAAKALASR